MARKSTRSRPLSERKAEAEVCHQEPQLLSPTEPTPFSEALTRIREGVKSSVPDVVDRWMEEKEMQKQHRLLRTLFQSRRGLRLLPPSDLLPPLP